METFPLAVCRGTTNDTRLYLYVNYHIRSLVRVWECRLLYIVLRYLLGAIYIYMERGKALVYFVTIIYSAHGFTLAVGTRYSKDYKWVPVHCVIQRHTGLPLVQKPSLQQRHIPEGSQDANRSAYHLLLANNLCQKYKTK